MLLARKGCRVLPIDRDRFPSDMAMWTCRIGVGRHHLGRIGRPHLYLRRAASAGRADHRPSFREALRLKARIVVAESNVRRRKSDVGTRKPARGGISPAGDSTTSGGFARFTQPASTWGFARRVPPSAFARRTSRAKPSDAAISGTRSSRDEGRRVSGWRLGMARVREPMLLAGARPWRFGQPPPARHHGGLRRPFVR
jgi:hypothetical protein